MNYGKVALMLLVAVFLLQPSFCQAAWQRVQSNGYTYYEDGNNRAYSFTSQYGTNEWYYQIHYGQSVWYWIPVPNADPTRDTYAHIYVDPVANRMWIAQDGQMWVEQTNPNLTDWKNYYDSWYNLYLANPNNPYYLAKYSEADLLFRVAKAIVSRNTQING